MSTIVKKRRFVEPPAATLQELPLTIRRLLAIKPGETIVYYTGNFDADIQRCVPRSPQDDGAPRYRHVLQSIRSCANRLASNKRVTLDTETIKHGGLVEGISYEVIAYRATGLAS
ncbi:MAG: hypothetical protein AAB421_05080 [Patescibacteria group bacterium]